LSDLLNRHCSVEGCAYEEPRGSREGDFVAGKFVCPDHFAEARFFDALPACPVHLRGGLERWLKFGIQPGSFLTAVLKGDQEEAAKRADPVTSLVVARVFRFVREFMPAAAHGSAPAFEAWKAHRGLERKARDA
jgi:hypothetical protein